MTDTSKYGNWLNKYGNNSSKSYFYHTPTLRYTPIERATMSEIDVDLIFT